MKDTCWSNKNNVNVKKVVTDSRIDEELPAIHTQQSCKSIIFKLLKALHCNSSGASSSHKDFFEDKN